MVNFYKATARTIENDWMEKKWAEADCMEPVHAYVDADWRRISLAFCWLALDNGPLNVMSCFKLSQRQAALSFFNRPLRLEVNEIGIWKYWICCKCVLCKKLSWPQIDAKVRNPFCAQFRFARFFFLFANFTRQNNWQQLKNYARALLYFLILFFFKSKTFFRNYTNKQIHVFQYIRISVFLTSSPP